MKKISANYTTILYISVINRQVHLAGFFLILLKQPWMLKKICPCQTRMIVLVKNALIYYMKHKTLLMATLLPAIHQFSKMPTFNNYFTMEANSATIYLLSQSWNLYSLASMTFLTRKHKTHTMLHSSTDYPYGKRRFSIAVNKTWKTIFRKVLILHEHPLKCVVSSNVSKKFL